MEVMEVLTRPVTADNFVEVASLPEYADCRVELVDGRIIAMPPPGKLHGRVQHRLSLLVGTHVVEHGLGEVLGSDAGFVLERNLYGGDTVRGLDLAFVSRDSDQRILTDEDFVGAPDLAVEVLSPGNTRADMRLKIRQLLNAGARHVWVVDPGKRQVIAHSLDGARTYYDDDTLRGGDILPGFEVKVADIFP